MTESHPPCPACGNSRTVRSTDDGYWLQCLGGCGATFHLEKFGTSTYAQYRP